MKKIILYSMLFILLCSSCAKKHLMSAEQKKENEGFHALTAQKVIEHRKENRDKHDKIQEENQKAQQEKLTNLNKTNPKVKPTKKRTGEFHFF